MRGEEPPGASPRPRTPKAAPERTLPPCLCGNPKWVHGIRGAASGLGGKARLPSCGRSFSLVSVWSPGTLLTVALIFHSNKPLLQPLSSLGPLPVSPASPPNPSLASSHDLRPWHPPMNSSPTPKPPGHSGQPGAWRGHERLACVGCVISLCCCRKHRSQWGRRTNCTNSELRLRSSWGDMRPQPGRQHCRELAGTARSKQEGTECV